MNYFKCINDIKENICSDSLINADCIEAMKFIQDKSIDCIICDLPYGTTKNKWDVIIPFNKLWKEYNRIIKDNGAIILFGNGLFTAELMVSNKKMWRYNLIWEKTTPTGFLNAKKMPLRNHEDICIFYKKPPIYNPQKTYGHIRKVSKRQHKLNCKETSNYGHYNLTTYDSTERYPLSVLKFKTDKQKCALHPTQKPVKLLEYLINTYTNEDNIILDNAAGSMSTAIAAINTNRKYICIEKDEKYFYIGLNRVIEAINLKNNNK